MNDLVDWVPTIVAVGAVGSLYFVIRKMISDFKIEIKEKITMQDEKIEKTGKELEEYMKTSEHVVICELNTLKVITEFNKSMVQWKDETFKFFRDFESKFEDKLIDLFRRNGFTRKE